LAAQEGDEQRWTFAALDAAIAIEHTLKAHLASVHSSLTRERPEIAGKTVTSEVAIMRFADPVTAGVQLGEADKVALGKAAKVRNKIAHGEAEQVKEALRAASSCSFAFLLSYHTKHMALDRHDFIKSSQFEMWRNAH
jgi:hypothetical protein